MRDSITLPEIAVRLPLVEADAVEAGVIAGKLGIPELLSVKALARLVTLKCAHVKGQDGKKYWGIKGVAVLVEVVRLDPGDDDAAPRVNASGRSHGSGFASFAPADSNEKRMRLTDVQLVFKHAKRRGHKYFLQAVEEVDGFARRNGGTRDARLIALRIQQLAFEEALEAVEYRIAAVHREAYTANVPVRKKASA